HSGGRFVDGERGDHGAAEALPEVQHPGGVDVVARTEMLEGRAGVGGETLLGGGAGITAVPAVVEKQRRETCRGEVGGGVDAAEAVAAVTGSEENRETGSGTVGSATGHEPGVELQTVRGGEDDVLRAGQDGRGGR